MTSLTLTPAMRLHGSVDSASATWVGLVESGDALAATDLVLLEDAEQFDRARILVRERGRIRGYVSLAVRDGAVDADELAHAVAELPPTAPLEVPPLGSISIVVCTRDRPEILREALASIAELDHPAFEVIVVDNAPTTQATRDLIESEFPAFRYVREDVPGLSHARNAGLAAATSPIVAFTDDDVVVDPLWLRAIASGFARADDVGCVSGIVPSGELRNAVQTYFDARVSWSKLTEPRVFRLDDPPADLPMFPFCVGEFGTGANFAVRRDHIRGLGGFDTALGAGTATKGGEDLDMFLRVLYDRHAIVVEPAAIVWHRHRSDLAALEAQAVGYGRGFGAWATTVVLDPRMARAAFARSPQALRRLVDKPMVSVDDGPQGPAASAIDPEIEGIGRTELASIAGGPWSYFRERHAQLEAGTFAGPPTRGPALERRGWALVAGVGGIFGVLAAIVPSTGLSLVFLSIFVLVGPGALVRAWVPLPSHLTPIVVPAIGLSAVILMVTALAFAGWWAPTISLLVIAVVTCAVAAFGAFATAGFRVRRTV